MMAQREPSFWFTAVSFRGRLRLAGRLPRADERPGSRGAWRSKASWYLATTDDRMIPPALEREMSERAGATVAETPAAIRSTSRSRALWPTSSSGLLPAWAD